MTAGSIRIYWRRYGPHGGGQWRAKLPDDSWVQSNLLEVVELMVSGWCSEHGATYYVDRTDAPKGHAA